MIEGVGPESGAAEGAVGPCDLAYIGATIDRNYGALAEVKRFVERWKGDPGFRQLYRENPEQALAQRNLRLLPGDVSYLLDPNAPDTAPTPLGRTLRELSHALQSTPSATQEIDARIEASCDDERFRRWRERQVRRLRSQQLLDGYFDIGHFPIAFELSDGCSVGCWFCSCSPERLKGIFAHSETNARLWRGILATVKRKLGDVAREGYCYWATDPFDNPDYEKFAADFYDVLGRFPTTTTALAMRYPDRTRALLALARARGGMTRLSVLSVPMLDKIHGQFTPEELSSTTLLFLVDDAQGVVRSIAGRARTSPRRLKASGPWTEDYAPASVSGFIVNMVTGRVQLVSPCRPSEHWPRGYRIHAEDRFTSEQHLEEVLENMIATHMSTTWDRAGALRFRPDLTYREIAGGFELSTRYKHYKVRHSTYPLRELGSLLLAGGPASPIVEGMAQKGAGRDETARHLGRLFDGGFFDDSP